MTNNEKLILLTVSLLIAPITFEGLKSSFLDQREVSVKDKEIRLSEISTQTNDKEVCQVLSKLDVCVSHDVNAAAIRSLHVPKLIKPITTSVTI